MWFAWSLGCPTHFTSRLTNFPLSSSSSMDVKYSQMLTQTIVAYTMISSLAAISSSNSSLLLEEFKSKCVKINSIDGKWIEPWKRKMKSDSLNPKKSFKSLHTPKWNGKLKTFKWNEIENKKEKMGSLPLIYHQRN